MVGKKYIDFAILEVWGQAQKLHYQIRGGEYLFILGKDSNKPQRYEKNVSFFMPFTPGSGSGNDSWKLSMTPGSCFRLVIYPTGLFPSDSFCLNLGIPRQAALITKYWMNDNNR